MKVVGVDEVGRGAWAGPVVAAAVELDGLLPGLKDSKLLSKKQRENVNEIIRKHATYIGIGWVTPHETDEMGLTAAVRLAMQRALHDYQGDAEIIVDGAFNFLSDMPKARCEVKADMTVPAVSAASIVAKVARDKYMVEISEKFPDYFFDKHVGYGTKLHLDQLMKLGVCELHRRSYKPIQALL